MKKYFIIFWLALFAALPNTSLAADTTSGSPNPGVNESAAQHDARMQWWREARFGMFIHWGIYAVPAQGEWYMTTGHVPKAEYEKYAQQFDPVKFDAATWVRIAKEAGMKYLVITSKHHDGFCMFNTKATDYNVVDATPWHHDPLKDLSEQCHLQGVRFCVYYSIMDWHHPDQAPAKDDPEHPEYNPTKMRPGRKADYTQYLKTQLGELIRQYHPGVLWFDGSWPGWWTEADGQALYNWLRRQDPSLIINNRVKGAGDYGTPEQSIPATGLKEDWETCMTINNNWGYNAEDHDFKSTVTLLRNLIDIASKGGNYLLNVGPTAQGIIPQPEVARLAAMGRWLKVNGDAIYDTTASPFKRLPWGRCTKRISSGETTLFLHVFDWPADGKLMVPGLKNPVESARLLVSGERLGFSRTEDGVIVRVPESAPDKISTTVVLEIKGAPDVAVMPILPRSDGSVQLMARDADLQGGLQYEVGGGKDNIGYWTDPRDTASWTFRIERAGKFTLAADIAAEASGRFEVLVGDQKLEGTAPATKSYTTFEKTSLEGELDLAKPGLTTLTVKPIADGWQPMNLRSITLVPAN